MLTKLDGMTIQEKVATCNRCKIKNSETELMSPSRVNLIYQGQNDVEIVSYFSVQFQRREGISCI